MLRRAKVQERCALNHTKKKTPIVWPHHSTYIHGKLNGKRGRGRLLGAVTSRNGQACDTSMDSEERTIEMAGGLLPSNLSHDDDDGHRVMAKWQRSTQVLVWRCDVLAIYKHKKSTRKTRKGTFGVARYISVTLTHCEGGQWVQNAVEISSSFQRTSILSTELRIPPRDVFRPN